MDRLLRRPQNPELLGRVFAALRVYSGQREPKNDAERGINDRLAGLGASSQAAQRMMATMDATRASARTSLLGEIADPAFVPEPEGAATDLAPTLTSDMASRMATDTAPSARGRRALIDDGRVADDLETSDGTRQELVYTVRYNGLWCQEESTWDRLSGSDEIYLITSSVHTDSSGENIVRTERHPVSASESWYGDVDSGEERTGPVAACWVGNADPVSVTVVVVEHDEGDPDAYKDEIDTLVKAILAVFGYFYPTLAWLELLNGPISDAINWVLDTDDDPVESQTVVLPRALLEHYAGQWPAPHIGYRISSGGFFGYPTVVGVATNFMQHFVTTHNGGGATYVAGLEVLRDPPIDRPIILL